MFAAVLQGEHELHGFHNADMRQQLLSRAKTKADERWQANAISRRPEHLHVRDLIATNAPRTRRWRVTARGDFTLASIIQLH